MKTYKIEPYKAASLRKQLLWSNIWAFVLGFLGIAMGAGAAASSSAALVAVSGLLLVGFAIATIVSIVAYWRSLWALWEWPGIAVGFGVAVAVVVTNLVTGFLGTLASLAFLVYVYTQLGKQAGAVEQSNREVFSE